MSQSKSSKYNDKVMELLSPEKFREKESSDSLPDSPLLLPLRAKMGDLGGGFWISRPFSLARCDSRVSPGEVGALFGVSGAFPSGASFACASVAVGVSNSLE